MKRAAIVAAFVLAGLAAGALWTLLQPDRYRADARVLVRPLTPAVEALAESSLIKTNVEQTLHLSKLPKVSAHSGKGGVLTVSAEASGRERARQIDAETVVILTQKIPQRFAKATATVLDPAHVAAQTSPTLGPNLLLGGLAGALVWLVVAGALSRGATPAATVADPRVERRLQARIAQVAERERALARRAGQLAAREEDLGRREQALRETPAVVVEPEPEPEPQPEPEPEPQPVAVREPALGALPTGGWTLDALEALTRQRVQQGASPEQQEEWSTYLFFLREHAGADGVLPASFDQLVNDIFAPPPRAT